MRVSCASMTTRCVSRRAGIPHSAWLLNPDSTHRIFLAADDLGDFEEWSVGFGRVLKDLLNRQRRLDDILAQDIVQGQGVGHRLHAADIELADLVTVLEDVLEFGGEPGEAVLVKSTP